MTPLLDEVGRWVGQTGDFLLRCSALLMLLFVASRVPLFRRVFYRRDADARSQVLYTLFWSFAALVAPGLTRSSAFVPFFAGLFSGPGPGWVVGAFAGTVLALKGYSLPTVFIHVMAGLAGGWLARTVGPGRPAPARLAFLAGLLSLAGMDRPDSPGRWLPLSLGDGPPVVVHLAFLAGALGLACLLFMRIMEYLLTEGDRERARAADRVLTLAGASARVLEEGLTPRSAEALAPLVREALEAPAVFVLLDDRVVAFEGSHPHLNLAAAASEGTAHHADLFTRCPEGCPYTSASLVALREGGRTVGHLGLLQTRSSALPASAEGTAEGLGTLLSGHLSAVRVREQRAALEEARLRFLQAQIRPHFLFNALNTIASLTSRDPAGARDLVVRLSRFLRESFRQDRPTVSLEHEMEVVEAYLAVEQARFGERLQVERELPDPLPRADLPPFTVQPLVENAVRHGVGERPEGGVVRLRVAPEGGGVRVSVEDSGRGMTPERLRDALEGGAGGIGLSNVRDRLQAMGPEVDFRVESGPEGTRVSFLLPLGAGTGKGVSDAEPVGAAGG